MGATGPASTGVRLASAGTSSVVSAVVSATGHDANGFPIALELPFNMAVYVAIPGDAILPNGCGAPPPLLRLLMAAPWAMRWQGRRRGSGGGG